VSFQARLQGELALQLAREQERRPLRDRAFLETGECFPEYLEICQGGEMEQRMFAIN